MTLRAGDDGSLLVRVHPANYATAVEIGRRLEHELKQPSALFPAGTLYLREQRIRRRAKGGGRSVSLTLRIDIYWNGTRVPASVILENTERAQAFGTLIDELTGNFTARESF